MARVGRARWSWEMQMKQPVMDASRARLPEGKARTRGKAADEERDK